MMPEAPAAAPKAANPAAAAAATTAMRVIIMVGELNPLIDFGFGRLRIEKLREHIGRRGGIP
jgi:hypothetical protein